MAKGTSLSELVSQSPRRPILTHLNADTSWLISFPRAPITDEKAESFSKSSSRSYYHVIVDPWLDGEIVLAYRWIMVLAHSVKASFSTMADVRGLVKEIEHAAGSMSGSDNGEVDAAFVSHYLDDHCRKESLVQIDPSVPVVTVHGAATMVQSWKHFQNIETMPDLDVGHPETLWQRPSSSYLPSYLRVGRVPSGGPYPHLHWATIIAYTASPPLGSSDSRPETILYSPHGIYSDRVSELSWATKHSNVLAMLHGLDPAWSPAAANLGVENGHALAKKIRPKFWIPTHDEHLEYQGLIGWFQTKYKKTFGDAVGSATGDGSGEAEGEERGPMCREVGNGESLVLA